MLFSTEGDELLCLRPTSIPSVLFRKRLLNTKSVSLNDLMAADAVAIGTPDYYSYVAGTIKTFFDDLYLWDKAGKAVIGKPAALFYSHGGGGLVKQSLEKFGLRFFKQVGETIERGPANAEEAQKKGRALGRELAQKVS